MVGFGIAEIILLALLGSSTSLVHSQPLLWMASSMTPTPALVWLLVRKEEALSGPVARIPASPPAPPPPPSNRAPAKKP
jgi:hypothetical protein